MSRYDPLWKWSEANSTDGFSEGMISIGNRALAYRFSLYSSPHFHIASRIGFRL